MTTTTQHITSVDQHTGDHEATGLRMTRLVEVRTDLADYVPTGDFEAMSDAEQTEVLAELAAIHDASVVLAGLDADHRGRAEEWIADNVSGCDFPSVASLTRKAIRETETE